MRHLVLFMERIGRQKEYLGDRNMKSPVAWDMSATKALWGAI